jgi:tricorn protease
MVRTLIILASAVALAPTLSADAVLRVSHPALSPDGAQIVACWQDDLWVFPAEGGLARRLTVSPAVETMPRWSPDGSRLFFASDRFGSFDVFSVRPDGGDIRRLTFDSAIEYPSAVSPDGTMLYGYTNAWGRLDLFRVRASGGEMVRLTSHPLETAFLPAVSRDGRTVFHVRGGGVGSWRRAWARGSATGEIWAASAGAPLTNFRRITRDEANDLFPLAAPDGLVWVSNRSGHPNLWRMRADGSRARQLTRHTEGTVRWPSISADGQRVAYEFDSRLFLYDERTGTTRQVNVSMPSDARDNPVLDTVLTSGVQEYAVAPDGKRIVIVVRGDLWLIPERGGTTRRLTDFAGFDGQPVWLDPRTIAFVSARTGKRELYTVDLEGNLKTLASDLRDLTSPALSPDGKTLAFHRGDREIVTMPVAGGPMRTVATGGFIEAMRGARQFSWSPDSKWLVYQQATERSTVVRCVNVESGERVEIARLARGGTRPQFLPNGRGVFFTAFDREESDVHVVDLVPAGLVFTEDDLDRIGAPAERPEAQVTVWIDPRGIERRLRRISSGGAMALLASPDSRTVWALADGALVAIPVAGGAPAPVAGVSGAVSSLHTHGGRLYFVSAGRLNALTLGGPGPAAQIGFSAEFTVERQAEHEQLFREIWWAIDRLFYDPELHGRDWARVKARYAGLVPHAYDRNDFYALMDEMVEEMGSSHMGATAPETTAGGDGRQTGWLGVEWDWRVLDARGSYIVASVAEGSPAAHPESELRPGDRLLTVDGRRVGSAPIAQMLERRVGRRVRLGIERGASVLEIAIQPASPGLRSSLNYENWVAWQRAETERLSGGRLTYLHIQAMNGTSLRRFLREIRTLTPGRQGVVIDVRFNGGGSTAHEILGVLIKTPWLIRTQRDEPDLRVSENIWRGDSLELPSVLLINSGSFSNAEIFAEGFRRLEIGPIVGEPTVGGVIGTSDITLFDGGSLRVPAIGTYTIDGDNLEGSGRRPDYHVPFDPNAWAAGRDPQLERAVQELLERM